MPERQRLLSRGSWPEARRLTEVLRERPSAAYCCSSPRPPRRVGQFAVGAPLSRLSEFMIGPESLHLRLSIAAWAADGLLAIFFFVVGLELKREFVAGDLRDPARPRCRSRRPSAGCRARRDLHRDQSGDGHPETVGVGGPHSDRHRVRSGRAGRALEPSARRAADFSADPGGGRRPPGDHVIAVFYTDHLSVGPLALALIPGGLFALAVQRGVRRWWVLVRWRSSRGRWCTPAVCTRRSLGSCWASPCRCWVGTRRRALRTPAAAVVGRLRGAGVRLLRRRSDRRWFVGARPRAAHPVTLGVVVGLVVGKPIGRVRSPLTCWPDSPARTSTNSAWRDVFGVSLLGGIGFTVSLLIGELAFGHGTAAGDDVKIGVLAVGHRRRMARWWC